MYVRAFYHLLVTTVGISSLKCVYFAIGILRVGIIRTGPWLVTISATDDADY